MVAPENTDVFSAATAPLTFHDFLERMRQPATADLVRSIKSFIVSFLSNSPNPESDSARVQEFLTITEAAFRAHPLWANASEDELESAGEGLEKYLMTKLFARAFAPVPTEVERDVKLSERIATLQRFIRPEHLDIPANFQSESSWLLAQKELQKINSYKAPRDKLVCILNCCRVINNLLLNVSMASNGSPPGADDFLPVLIYVVMKANPPQLQSNLLYIQRYRAQSRLVSEAAYFYTNLVSAATFLETINASSLSMDPAEFDMHMREGAAVAPAELDVPATLPAPGVAPAAADQGPSVSSSPLPTTSPMTGRPLLGTAEADMREPMEFPKATPAPPPTPQQPPPPEPSPQKRASVAELEAAGAQSLVEADQSGQLARDYPFLYANVGDLRVADVELLLQEYKELAIKYIALAWAVEKAQDGEAKRSPIRTSIADQALKAAAEARTSDPATSDQGAPVDVVETSSAKPPALGDAQDSHINEKLPRGVSVDLLTLSADPSPPPQEISTPLTSMSLSPSDAGGLFEGLQMMSSTPAETDVREGGVEETESSDRSSGKGEEGSGVEGEERGMVSSRSTLSLEEGSETVDATILTPSTAGKVEEGELESGSDVTFRNEGVHGGLEISSEIGKVDEGLLGDSMESSGDRREEVAEGVEKKGES